MADPIKYACSVTIAGGQVYGDHTQVKAVQSLILEVEELRRKVADSQGPNVMGDLDFRLEAGGYFISAIISYLNSPNMLEATYAAFKVLLTPTTLNQLEEIVWADVLSKAVDEEARRSLKCAKLVFNTISKVSLLEAES